MQKSALEKLIATDHELRDFGFVWPDLDMILLQISSELSEVKAVSYTHLTLPTICSV